MAATGRSPIEYAYSFMCEEKEVAGSWLKVAGIDRDTAGGIKSQAIPPDPDRTIEITP